VDYMVSPTDERPFTHKLKGVSPTGEQNSNIEIIKDNINNIYTPQKDFLFLGELENVKLSLKEKEKLNETLGEDTTNSLIQDLSFYLASTGKKYKSHYATLLNWARRKTQNINNKSITLIK